MKPITKRRVERKLKVIEFRIQFLEKWAPSIEEDHKRNMVLRELGALQWLVEYVEVKERE